MPLNVNSTPTAFRVEVSSILLIVRRSPEPVQTTEFHVIFPWPVQKRSGSSSNRNSEKKTGKRDRRPQVETNECFKKGVLLA